MNINYALGIILIVLACVFHTNYAKKDKDGKKSLDNKKNNSEVENMLLSIATIIQSCIDEKTMNNKEFKTKLDKLYGDEVKEPIKDLITTFMTKVKKIKTKYERDIKLLKIMNDIPNSESSKNKSSKKSSKK